MGIDLMARPRIEIDFENFKKLCGLQCVLSEIAAFFDCSEDTIERWCRRDLRMSFAEAYKKYSASGKISLRRWQFKMAEHNPTMAIWLGKQWLNQTDKQEVAVAVQDDDTVKEMQEYFDRKKEEQKDV